MHYSLIKHTPKQIKLLLKKELQKSTNYASKIPQLIFPNSPVIYELETRTIQQKSVLNLFPELFTKQPTRFQQKCKKCAIFHQFVKRFVCKNSSPLQPSKECLKLEKCSQESLKIVQGKVKQFACKTVQQMTTFSKNRATSKINFGQPRMSFETLNISNESTNLVLSPVKTVFKNSN